MRVIVVVVAALAVGACRVQSQTVARPAPVVHLADCRGPARSLPDSLARRLPPRPGRKRPDDDWAGLALAVPGGFAGVFYDSAHTPILQLTHPELADRAKAGLGSHLAFPVQGAVVRPARWDFAQLVDWFSYLYSRLPDAPMGDKDEALNRIRLTATSAAARDRLIQALAAMDLPCDLVVIDPGYVTVKY